MLILYAIEYIFCLDFQGDTGGPLTLTGKSVAGTPNARQCLAGIASFFSSAGCEKGVPAGGTRIAYFIDWITQETGVAPCDACSA